jgi:hypothetical protein
MAAAFARLSSGQSLREDVHDEFLASVCADEQLLRDEFDAIIAAEWPDVPPSPSGGEHGLRRGRPNEPRAGSDDHGWLRHRRHRPPGIGGWVRQRSPPDAAHTAPLTGG